MKKKKRREDNPPNLIIVEWDRDIRKHVWLYNRLVGFLFLHVVVEVVVYSCSIPETQLMRHCSNDVAQPDSV